MLHEYTATLSPESLIVDDVLAVGDAEFQKKCLGRMREVSSGLGRYRAVRESQHARHERLVRPGNLARPK